MGFFVGGIMWNWILWLKPIRFTFSTTLLAHWTLLSTEMSRLTRGSIHTVLDPELHSNTEKFGWTNRINNKMISRRIHGSQLLPITFGVWPRETLPSKPKGLLEQCSVMHSLSFSSKVFKSLLAHFLANVLTSRANCSKCSCEGVVTAVKCLSLVRWTAVSANIFWRLIGCKCSDTNAREHEARRMSQTILDIIVGTDPTLRTTCPQSSIRTIGIGNIDREVVPYEITEMNALMLQLVWLFEFNGATLGHKVRSLGVSWRIFLRLQKLESNLDPANKHSV